MGENVIKPYIFVNTPVKSVRSRPNFWYRLVDQFDTCPNFLTSWGVRCRSYDVICQVTFGRNRRILRSIVSECVSLLSGVCFSVAGSIIDLYRYLEAIYGCPGVKVTQGHAALVRFRGSLQPL